VDGEESDPVIPAGRIAWQDPPPETAMPRDAVVHLTTSGGPAAVTVPDVIYFEMEQARQVVEAAGLAVGGVDTIPSPTEAGIIVATRPAPGTSRPPGSAVALVVSTGPADIRVPDVVGTRQEEARARLEAAGLHVGTVTTRSGGRKPAGTVLDQRPSAGVMASHDGRVNLVIAN
jgi:eukaryotic-like serine/threonine-protein kinase